MVLLLSSIPFGTYEICIVAWEPDTTSSSFRKSESTLTEDNKSRQTTNITTSPIGVGLPLSNTWKVVPVDIPSWSIIEINFPLSRRVSFDFGSNLIALE